jgi:flagellar hook-basal body complex protein FliE
VEIGRIQGVGAPLQTQMGKTEATGSGFADMLGKALNQLQSVTDEADAKVQALATGQDVELHDVMLALEAESMAMSLATTVRNKAVEAYQEIFRMQF